jgi:hypothetical protein
MSNKGKPKPKRRRGSKTSEITPKLTMMLLDFEDYSLRIALDELDSAILGCERRIDGAMTTGNDEYAEAVTDDVCDVVETLLGAAFVLCQNHISFIVSMVQRLHRWAANPTRRRKQKETLTTTPSNKLGIMRYDSTGINGTPYTAIEVMDAFANYFKHHDEWTGAWPHGLKERRQQRNAAIIMAVGAEQCSTGILRQGSRALGNPDFHHTTVFAGILKQWASNLRTAYEKECESNGLTL